MATAVYRIFVCLCLLLLPAVSVAEPRSSCARQILQAHSWLMRADLRAVAGCALALEKESREVADARCASLRTTGRGIDRVTTAVLRRLRLRCHGWPAWLPARDCSMLPDSQDRESLETCVTQAAHCTAAQAFRAIVGDEVVAKVRAQHPQNLAFELGGIAGNRLDACLPPPASTTTTTTIAPTTTLTEPPTTTLVLPTTTIPDTTTTLASTTTTIPDTTTTLASTTTTIPDTTTTFAPTTTTMHVDATTTTVIESPTTTMMAPTTTVGETPTTTIVEVTTTMLVEATTTTQVEPTTTTLVEPTTTIVEPTTTLAPPTSTLPEPTTTLPPPTTTTTTSTTTSTTTTTTITTTTTTLDPTPRLVVTEIASNPEAVADTVGEYFEIYNAGGSAVNLQGLVVKDKGSDTFTVSASLTVPAAGFVVMGRSAQAAGGHVDYVYGSSMSLTNTTDSIVLVWNGQTIDTVTYGAGFSLVAGSSISLAASLMDAQGNDVAAAWCRETAPLVNGDFGSPGRATTACTP